MPPVFAIFALAIALFATAVAARASELPTRIDVRADTLAFFPYTSDDSLLAGAGHVVVRAGARTIEADALRYNVLRNTLTASGDVRVTDATKTLFGTAYRLDLASGSAYLLRLYPLPATFALQDDDMTTANETAAPPGTFEQIDLDGQRPYIRSRHAIVNPTAGVRMSPAEFPTGAGPALTLPTYLYTLVQNPYIGQTVGSAASFDQPYNLFASPNSLTAAHVRYEAQNGVTFALDNRLVEGARAYAVTSIVPLRNRRADLLAFQALGPGLQQTFAASHTFSGYANNVLQYRLQNTGKLTVQTLSAFAFDSSNGAELVLSTISHDVGRYFTYALRTSYGYDHNLYGYPFANDFRTSGGGYVTTPGITLLGASANVRYDYNLTSYDFPHEVAGGTLTFSGGRPFAHGLSLYASAAFAQIANRYRNGATAARALGLPDPRNPYFAPDGTLFPGYFAFTGSNTFRTYQLTTTVQGRAGDNRMVFTLTHTHDFPQYHGFGRPPLSAFLDVTRRLTPTIRIEIGRSYDFGWGGRYFSPQYTFAISP